jgi:hypothetical protein
VRFPFPTTTIPVSTPALLRRQQFPSVLDFPPALLSVLHASLPRVRGTPQPPPKMLYSSAEKLGCLPV